MPSPRTLTPTVSPTPETVKFARDALHQLPDDSVGAHYALVDAKNNLSIPLPEQVYEILRSILIDMAANRPIQLIPLAHELTTHQAAELLNVSRGFVLRLIKDRELTCRMVGTHRRIRLEDLLNYQARSLAASDKALEDLVAVEQEMGLD